MERINRLLQIMPAALSLWFLSTLNVSSTETFCAVVKPTPDGFVALRRGPGTSYPMVERLRPFDLIWVGTEACRDGLCDNTRQWNFVEAVPRTLTQGWIRARYIKQVACPDEAAEPRGTTLVRFEKASQQQTMMLEGVLGQEALSPGATSFPPANLIAKLALGDNLNALFALTRSACSNHACSIEVLVDQGEKWRRIASFETWAPPYVLDRSTHGMRDIIVFDHVTDDCYACSPPQPVHMIWDPEAKLSDTEKGNYVTAGIIPRQDQHLYKITKYQNLR
jgi:hypothetical protein